MRSPELLHTPVLTAVELTARWSDLLEPPVFGARSLWLAWVGSDGLMLPLITPIDDVPNRPDRTLMPGLRLLHETVTEAKGAHHLAMSLCRPGRPAITTDDADWAEALREDVGDHLDGPWSLHLAAGGTVTPLVNPPLIWR